MKHVIVLVLLLNILFRVNAQSPTYLNSIKLGLDQTDTLSDLKKLKTSNDVIISSYFYNYTNYGSANNFTSQGSADILLSRYTSTLQYVWSISFGGSNSDQSIALGIDSSDNIILGAITYSTSFSVGSTVVTNPGSNGTSAVVLAKFNSSGELLWAKPYGGNGDATLYSVAVDSSDNILFCGGFEGTADFGGGAVSSNATFKDWIVAKYFPNGTFVWNRVFGGTGLDIALGITVDPSTQDVLIVGTYQSPDFAISGTLLPNIGSYDALVVKLSGSTGNVVWYKYWGSTNDDYLASVTVDSTGSVVSLGGCGGALTPSLQCSQGIWILKLSNTGNVLFSKNFNSTTTNFDFSPKIQLGSQNSFYTVGHYAGGNTNIDGTVLPVVATNGDYGSYIASFGSDGSKQWAQGYSSTVSVVLRSVAADNAGTVIYGGYFGGDINLGGPTLSTALGDTDAVVFSITEPSPSPSPSRTPSTSPAPPTPSTTPSSTSTPSSTPSGVPSTTPSSSPSPNKGSSTSQSGKDRAAVGGAVIALIFAGIATAIYWCCRPKSNDESESGGIELHTEEL